jgi:Tol biopolymer transport system component/lysophospholipase L1-like esterase
METTGIESRFPNSRDKALVLLLISLLLANPIIIYILTNRVWIALVAPFALTSVVFVVWSRWKSRLLKAYFLNAVAVVSVFVNAEVVFRTSFPDYVIEDLYTIEDGYYFNKPNLQQHFTDKEYSVDYVTNCQGYRIAAAQDPQQRVEKADWLFIGDSFTQGAQVEFEELYTTLLYGEHPDKIVVNAGISGAGIAEEYNYYRKKGWRLGAGTVFLQLCSFNDFMNVRPTQKTLTDHLMHYSAFIRFLLQGLKYQNPEELPLGRWAEPFSPTASSNRDYNIFFKEDSPAKMKDLQEFDRYLRLFAGEVRKRGARLVVFLIPTKEQVRLDWFEEVIREFKIRPDELDMRRPNRFLKELAGRYGIDYVDMLDPFLSVQGDTFYQYDEHLTAQGHRLIAKELSKVVPAERTPMLLSSNFAGDRYARYSTDGKQITFQSPRAGSMEIFLADPEFRNQKRLTADDVSECHPALSPDNNLIAFTQGEPETHRTKVILANVRGLGIRTTITSDSNVFGSIPSFSPDGRLLAYAGWRCEKNKCSNPQIIIHDLSTSQNRSISDPGYESWRPAFSPDGKVLAYIAKPQDQFDIFFYDLETEHEERAMNTPFDEWDPAFSPDGKFLVYSAKLDGNWDLFLLEIKTHKTTRLTATKGDEWDPSFSPNGDQIIFAGAFGLQQGVFKLNQVR